MPIEGFCNAIVLQGVICGKVMFCPFCLKEFHEFAASILTAAIGSESLDLDSMLSVCPCCVELVCLQCFIFGVENVNAHIVHMIICKGDIVAVASKAS